MAVSPDRVSLAVRVAVAATLLLVALHVMGQGWLPEDDALSYAAHGVSGKALGDVLVLREGVVQDDHPGWTFLMRRLHTVVGVDLDGLVVVGVTMAFVAYLGVPALLARRPEAFVAVAAALLVLEPFLAQRLMIGRPLLLTLALWAGVATTWERLRGPNAWLHALLLVPLFALAAWFNAVWYQFALPVLCVALAGGARAGALLGASWLAGTALGGVMTGDPVGYLAGGVRLGQAVAAYMGRAETERQLAMELWAGSGSPLVLLAVGLLLAWRTGQGDRPAVRLREPAFLTAAAGWLLGLGCVRFWADWGVTSLLVWATRELDAGLPERWSAPRPRLAGTLVACLVFAAVLLPNRGDRWRDRGETATLSAADPDQAPWLPEPGGVVYNTELQFFYRTFYANPTGPWRYVLGRELAATRPEDFEVLWAFKAGRGDWSALQPWAARLRPEDRLVVHGGGPPPPFVPALAWRAFPRGWWVGRLPAGR